MKKLVLVLLCLVLCSCTKTNEEITYIEPVNDLYLFDYLKEDVQDVLFKANGYDTVENNYLKMIGEKLPEDLEVETYDGSILNFNDLKDKTVILEAVANWCTHCQDQTKNNNPDLEDMDDVVFIQYFNVGDKEEIKTFYEEIEMEIPDNIIIIPHDDNLKEYVDSLHPLYYPSFFIYRNGILFFATSASLTYDDYAIIRSIDNIDLLDENGQDVRNLLRDRYALYDDLSIDDQAFVDSLSSDNKSLLLNNIGKKVDYSDTYIFHNNDLYNISDLSFYQDKNVIFYYLMLDGEDDQQKVDDLNTFISENKNLEVIAVLSEGSHSSIFFYEGLERQIDAVVTTSDSDLPKVIYNFDFETYPAFVFVEKGTITGALYQEDLNINDYLIYFFGEEAIAHQ